LQTMSASGEFRQNPPQLDPGLQQIIQADIAQGFSVNLRGDLAKYIKGNREVFEAGLAPQMAGVIDYLTVATADKQAGVSSDIDTHMCSRALAVFDQFVDQPDELEPFLADSRVRTSPIVQSDDFLSVVPIRYWNCGGDTEPTTQILSFALKNTGNNNVVEERFMNGLASSLYKREIDPVRLQHLLDRLPSIVGEERVEAFRNKAEERLQAIEKAAQLAIEAQQAQAAKDAERVKAQQELERQGEECRAILKEIMLHPNGAFGELLQRADDNGDGANVEKVASALLPSAASTYLIATRRVKGEAALEKQATDIIRGTFEKLLHESPSQGSIVYGEDFKALAPHLALLVPDLDALDDLALQVPSLWGDEAFYTSWKNVLIDDRLRKQAAESIDQEKISKLVEQDVTGLKVEAPYIGVPYDGIDSLTEDLRKYFVHGIGDLSKAKLAHTSEILDDSSGFATSILSKFSRSDEEILQHDIVEPLLEFMMDIGHGTPGQDGLFLFETRQARRGGMPYKYESTNFAGHAVSIKVAIIGNDRYQYYLDMRGGGYETETYSGERLARFAAFVGKEVAYPAETDAQIEIKRGEELRIRRVSDEEVAALEASLRAAGREPAAIPSFYEGKKWEERTTWYLPYKSKPHQAATEVVHDLLGDGAPLLYSIGYEFNKESRIPLKKLLKIPEPQKTFEISTTFDEDLDQQPPRKSIRLSQSARL
jgi:hypothetical protein